MQTYPEPVVRLTRPDDLNTLKSLDLKTHQYPMPMDEWQKRLKGSGKNNEARIVVCEVLRRPVGFAMWSIDEEHSSSHLLRLGILPDYRRKGLGGLLVRACLKHSHDERCDKVKIVVPHINCHPGDPDDVSVFMNRCGFMATGEIIHDWREMYGKSIDGYIFERQLHVDAP